MVRPNNQISLRRRFRGAEPGLTRPLDRLWCWRRRPVAFAPDPLGGLDERAELVQFVFRRDLVSHDRGREAALRAHGEPLYRYVLCGLPDAGFELFDGLALSAGLGGDEAEDDGLLFGDVAERLEVTRALVVIFEEQAVGGFVGEDLGWYRPVGGGR